MVSSSFSDKVGLAGLENLRIWYIYKEIDSLFVKPGSALNNSKCWTYDHTFSLTIQLRLLLVDDKTWLMVRERVWGGDAITVVSRITITSEREFEWIWTYPYLDCIVPKPTDDFLVVVLQAVDPFAGLTAAVDSL